jgi:AraC-like DNA-binding protein
MAFELRGISNHNFQRLNDFFSGKEVSHGLTEHSEKLVHPGVEGLLKEWYFDDIRIAYSDLSFKKNLDLNWKYEINPDLVTLQANIHGSVFVENHSNPFQLFGNYQHNLFSSSSGTESEGYLRPDNLRTSMFFIQFTKEAFLRITQDANETLDCFSNNVLTGNYSILSAKNLPVSTSMLNIIHNIVNCGYKNGLKRMYLLSKSIEFLVLQAEASERALNPAYKYIKTEYDEKCIFYAREYVLRHLVKPPGLSELAKIVGVNEYKLKRGFKELFGNTVFGFIADARLEMAKNHLLENNKSISQIASDLGYSSLPHFSYAFKKKFGLSPAKLLKR